MLTNNPRMTTESLMEEIRAGARAARMGDASGGDTSSNAFGGGRAPAESAPEHKHLALQPDFEPRDDDRYHARDLLQYHDRNFIQNAYRAILKRGPDATGYTAFIEGLRSGHLNKIDVLARLRYSTEGRAKKVEVKGLFVPAAVRQLYRVPLLGYLLRLLIGIARLPAMVRHQQQLEAHTHAQLQLIVDHINHLLDHANRLFEGHGRQLESLAQEQQSIIAAHEAAKRALTERFNAVKQQFDVLIERAVARWQREMQVLKAQREESVRAEQQIRTELTMQGQRVARLLEEATQHPANAFAATRADTFADEQEHLHDAFYLSFEEHFRGSPSEIKERLKIYLPLVERARAANQDAQPLLDIGCGRGEWLELLREANIPATGVDSNRALVGEGQARGLSIIESDLMAYLREVADSSLCALTGFHIVEHLPLETLLRLLDEAVRVVAPGGLVVFETPNPENVLVGSCNFYFDPTHRNPLPAPVMQFLLESRGLSRVEIIRLNPSDAEPVAGDTDLVRRFNQYFYGPMDYAVVGWKA